jgi:two-component system LytT family response regulator
MTNFDLSNGKTAATRVVLVDDEPLARDTLRSLLANDERVQLVGEAVNGEQALELVRREKPELLFLDIEMPGLSGMQVAQALGPAERPAIIFTTAYEQYALQAFEVHAVDYLLKPFEDVRFQQALERALTYLGGEATLPVEAEGQFASRLSIHKEGRIEIIEVAQLRWVQAADQYVRLHTENGEILARRSMSDIEQLLDPERFLRCHRSAICALDRIRRLETMARGGGMAILDDQSEVPVSRSRVAAMRKVLG